MRKYKKRIGYVSHTFIINERKLNILCGLAKMNNLDITNVLEQSLSRAFIELDKTTIERAEQIGKRYYEDTPREYKNIFD